MRVSGAKSPTYLYVNGISVSREICLSESVYLLPATPTFPAVNIETFQDEISYGAAIIFLCRVRSQIRIVGEPGKAFAGLAWNTAWDSVILGAVFDCLAECNFQCDQPIEDISADSNIILTNFHLRGVTKSPPYLLSEEDAQWVESNIGSARSLLSNNNFSGAVHSLSSYRWHTVGKVQLAIIWAGIEGLFEIESEIVFRISLYIARYLEPNEESARRQLFQRVKKLYSQRSKAVHGGEIKENIWETVSESAGLLARLVRRCVEQGGLPDASKLAP